MGRCYSFVVSVNSSLDESGAVVGFETSNNSLVLRLDVGSEIGFEVLNLDALEVGRNDMARKVILNEKYLSSLCLKFMIPLLNPVLIEMGCHPGLCITSVIKS